MAVEALSTADLNRTSRYEALIKVSEALGACHEREELFRALVRELRHVLSFDFLGLSLYDEEAHAIVPLALEPSGEPVAPPSLSADDSITYWIVREQAPVLIPVIDRETRFPRAMEYLRRQGTRSACALPLTTPRRRLGMLLAGSQEPHAYDAEDITFLSLVARQVALAVGNALNYSALQQTLGLERERVRDLETSDELLRALSDVLDVREIFPRVSEIARTVLPHDRLTLTFHEDGGRVLVHAASGDATFVGEQVIIPDPQRLQDGTFTIVDDCEGGDFPPVEPCDFWERTCSGGYQSVLCVRMHAHEQRFGLQFWAKRRGAFDEGQVPIARRIADHVALAISHERLALIASQAAEEKLRADRLEARVRSLTTELDAKLGVGHTAGHSAAWKAVLKAATQVASTDTTVLLVGESGTGKEVIARFVHRASERKAGPFVAINCAALPEQLLEAELFGYERGAFTGALQAKPGQIELAAGGVLFLDEVSEMSLSAQAKFLRVLQEREFQRLGATRTLKANVRIIAATNRDLRKAMERGDFRDDLYYRLRVFDIALPPLCAREGDILPLSEVFLREIGQRFGRPPAGLTRDARQALLEYQWPGNVRELRNALERAAILCEGGLITAEHLSLNRESARPPAVAAAGATTTQLPLVERDMIARVMAECAGNKSRAATRLGLSRTQLYVRLRKYQLA